MSGKFYESLLLAATLLMASQAVVAANLTVVQEDLPVGQSITVAGIKYQMMQFEVPVFGSDTIYLVKFPVIDGTAAPEVTPLYAHISVYSGSKPFGRTLSGAGGVILQPGDVPNTINAGSTGLSGFQAFYAEGYGYSANYNYTAPHYARLENRLGLGNAVAIQLDAKTYVSLILANKITSQSAIGENHIPDTSGSLHATPTALTRAQRNKFLVDSRALFKYVSIKEKQ